MMRFEKGDVVLIIYIDRKGRLTERYVRVISATSDLLAAYCYYRRQPRSFAMRNILAARLKSRPAS
jgi:predicted DNA-binding transcriptional regulator YafY